MAVGQAAFLLLDVPTEWEKGKAAFDDPDLGERMLWVLGHIGEVFSAFKMDAMDKILTDITVARTGRTGPALFVSVFVEAAEAYARTERRVQEIQGSWRELEDAGFYALKDRFGVLLNKVRDGRHAP